MTEPSQYFKGRTVQEQMNEVIGYVDARAEEVAAAKADDVLEPAEQAKDDAIAAKKAAEQARDTTLAALPQIQQDITDLKAEDVALDGRLDNVELRITTAEGNIVTIQGRVTAVENKNTQQDSAIAALQTADGQNVKINNINQYAVGLTGNQNNITGQKGFKGRVTARTELDQSSASADAFDTFDFTDKDGNLIFVQHLLHVGVNSDAMQFRLYSPDGQKWIAFQLAVTNDTCSCSVYTNTGRTAYILDNGAWQQ